MIKRSKSLNDYRGTSSLKKTGKKIKAKKHTLTWYKKKAWEAFSVYVRLRDWNQQGRQYIDDVKAATCITCPKLYPVEGKGTMQAGHFIPGRNNSILFDENQVNAQCYNCNVNLKGNWPAYYQVMLERHGQDALNSMINQSYEIKKFTIPELQEMTLDFQQRVLEYQP